MKAEKIAEYILYKAGKEDELISNMKLQKLLYYCQGFHLAIIGDDLFEEEIVNWMHGPVVVEVYDKFKGNGANAIDPVHDFNESEIPQESKELIDEVYSIYGQFSASALRNMTHNEPPWKSTENFEIISRGLLKEFFLTRIVENGEEG